MGNKAYKPTLRQRLEKLEKKVKKLERKELKPCEGLPFNKIILPDWVKDYTGLAGPDYPHQHIGSGPQSTVDTFEIDLLKAENEQLKKEADKLIAQVERLQSRLFEALCTNNDVNKEKDAEIYELSLTDEEIRVVDKALYYLAKEKDTPRGDRLAAAEIRGLINSVLCTP